MGAVWYRARVELRRTVRAMVLLIVLVGVTGGIVLAAVAGAQRSRDAIPEFLAYARGPAVGVQIDPFSSAAGQTALARQLTALPEWETAAAVAQPVLSMPPQGDQTTPAGFVATGVVAGPYLADIDRPIVVDGRLPDPTRADEVAVNDGFVDTVGLGVGDAFDVRTVTTDHLDDVVNSGFSPDADGQDLRLTITGIVREPWDLGYDPSPSREPSLRFDAPACTRPRRSGTTTATRSPATTSTSWGAWPPGSPSKTSPRRCSWSPGMAPRSRPTTHG